MKQVFLFDLDGTLIDSFEGIAKSVQYALADFSVYEEDLDKLAAFIGPPLLESFMKLYGFDEAGAEAAIVKYRERYSVTGVLECALYPGIRELITEQFGRGKTLVLATSKPEVYAKEILEHFGLTAYFEGIFGAALDGGRTQKADVIAYTLEHLPGVQLADCVMIGDRKHDILGSHALGMDNIGVLYGFGDRAELEAAGADRIVDDVAGLAGLLLEY